MITTDDIALAIDCNFVPGDHVTFTLVTLASSQRISPEMFPTGIILSVSEDGCSCSVLWSGSRRTKILKHENYELKRVV